MNRNTNYLADAERGREVKAENRKHRAELRNTLLDEVAALKAQGLNSLQIATRLAIPLRDANMLYAEAIVARAV